MKKPVRILAGAIAAAMVMSMSACGDKKATDNSDTTKISWWIANSASPIVKSYDDIAAVQKLQEKFNVDIEFFHPSAEQETEQFNIMAASGDFKDIVSFNWNGYTGGPVKAAKDGAILVLDDYLDKNMPNLLSLMNQDSAMNYLARCYDGSVSVLPGCTNDIITGAVFGPQIRKDWLDKLGLSVPKTIDDWYNVLTAFKTKDPNGNGQQDEVPFVADGTATFLRFSYAFGGVDEGFYVNGDNKIAFGFIEPEYKEFLTMINKWYKEGLIDPEYAAVDSSMIDTKMISDVGGSFIGYSGSAMSKYLAAARAGNPDYTLVGTQWPTANGGEPYCGYSYQIARGTPGRGMAIAATNKNIEKTLQMIDYMYGEEGSVLFNWGILDDTYEKTVGGFHYTEKITNSPDGKSPIEAITPYALTQWPPVMMRADAFMELNGAFPEQTAAMELWNQADTSRIMPSLTISPEEQSEITKVMDDIYIYRREWINKFVMGVEPISKWDEVAQQVRSMGIDKAIAVYQTAYDRYINQ